MSPIVLVVERIRGRGRLVLAFVGLCGRDWSFRAEPLRDALLRCFERALALAHRSPCVARNSPMFSNASCDGSLRPQLASGVPIGLAVS